MKVLQSTKPKTTSRGSPTGRSFGSSNLPNNLNSATKVRTKGETVSPRWQQIGIASLGIIPLILSALTSIQLAAYNELHQEQGHEDKTGLGKFIEFVKTWIPFINEAAIVLTGLHDRTGFFNKLYVQGSVQQSAIDATALTGILWNSLDEAKEYGNFSGFMKGVGLILFSFILPGKVIPRFQEIIQSIFHRGSKTGFFAGPFGNLVSGIGMIVILEACTRLWDAFVIPMSEDVAAWMKEKFGHKPQIANNIVPFQRTNTDQPSRDNQNDGDNTNVYANLLVSQAQSATAHKKRPNLLVSGLGWPQTIANA
ncbi:MAG: hypothetical protein QNJ31_03110 [Candidatus Caenarcaniphilales bacterium]|nr:hypothetical protein [Candidatus Caenarcaniphilales bacterium]